MNCPSCRQPMIAEQFGRHAHGEVTLDFCYPCHAIWFDHMESTQLSPAAVIELFRRIHAHQPDGHRPFSDRLGCVRCQKPLTLVHDLQKGGRLSYHRCPEGHGRLTSFFQFLREKQFVRNLSAGEISELKATVKQVRCSGCGGPINLTSDTACGYCRAPIAVLDSQAVEKALAALSAKAGAHGVVDPAKLETLMRENDRRRRELDRMSGNDSGGWFKKESDSGISTVDLVAGGIAILVALIT